MLQQKGEVLPLSVAQRGLWVSSKLAPADIVLTIAEALEIHGAVDEAMFIASLLRVAADIEPSRTRIVEEASGPRQIVSPRFEGRCPVLDFSAREDPFAAAMAWMQAELSRPINFASDPLWASALLRLGDSRHVWYHRCHHVVMDGFSGGLIAQRLAEIYNAMAEGRDPPESGFGRVADLLGLEREYRASERHVRDRAYWMEQLADLPAPVSLATRGRHAGTGPLRRHTATLGEEATRRLATLARDGASTLPQILIALVAVYVHRVTGAPDLALGMPVTGRVGRALRNIPAMVANAVVMRFRFAPGMALADVVAQSGRNMRGALRHQQFRYEDLRRALGLFHTDQQISWTGVNIEPFDFDLRFGGHRSTAHNLSNGPVEDLTVFIYDRNDGRGLRIDFDANARLYTADELARHAERLLRMIAAATAAPETPIAALPLLAAGERDFVLSVRGPALAVGEDDDPLARLARVARDTPDAVAVRGEDGSLAYGALAREVARIAGALRDAGIGPGRLVAIAPDRATEMVAIVLGVLASGAAFLPLDPDGPPERAALILADASPAAMIAPRPVAARLGFPTGSAAGDEGAGAGSALFVGGASFGMATVTATVPVPAGTAYVIYTSGSTGTPKGVVVPRGALANLLAGIDHELRFSAADRLLAVTTLGFDIAILELLLPLRNGGTVVVATRKQVLEPRTLAHLIRAHGVTAMQATPSLWSVMLAAGQLDALRGLTVMAGGEALPGHLARRLLPVASRLVNLYGPTETTIWSTIQRIGPAEADQPPIGRPLANQRVRVLDAAGEPTPIDVAGELCIGGPGVATGYFARPELTAERFVADPFATGERLYRTGDRAAIRPDGGIDYLGRADDQVKVRGVRIEPGETEAALLAIAGVAQAAAVLRRDGDDVRLCGYLVAEPGVTLDPDELRQALARKVPEAAIPTAWAVLDAFPLNANGKLDRRALPPPEHAKRAGYVAPRTPDEEMLAEIWAELFGLDRIGVHDNFFALGGDSLIAAQLIAELSARFGAELPLGAMFEDATLESLAAQLAGARTGRGERRDPLAELLPIRARGEDPAVFCIHPVSGLAWGYTGLLRYVGQNHPIYGLQSFGAAPAESLGALASRYVALARSVQPHGPYNLLGFSFGGLVAHEMARLLEAAGERVGFLGLLDAYPYRPANAAGDDSVGLETIMRDEEGEFVRAALGFLGLHQDALGEQAGMDDLVDHLAGVYDLAGRATPKEVGNTAELVARLRRVTETNLALARAHKPGVVAADVLFVRATERTEGAATLYLHDRPEAWRPYLTGQLERRDVACGHQDMLDGPAMESVGPWVAARLDRRDPIPGGA